MLIVLRYSRGLKPKKTCQTHTNIIFHFKLHPDLELMNILKVVIKTEIEIRAIQPVQSFDSFVASGVGVCCSGQ